MRWRHRQAFQVPVCAAALLLTNLAHRAHAVGREIPLARDGAVYRVPVTLNGRLVRPFIVDTGAGEVQVSIGVLQALFPRGSAPPMYLPSATYRLADGRMVQDRRFLIPSLRIGDQEFHQVAASIGGSDAPLLLGQNVLSLLGTWRIDSRRNVLVLAERPSQRSPRECADWRTAPDECEVAVVRDFLRDVRPPHNVTTLKLLRSDGQRASVLVDVVRDGRRRTARLCGPIDLHYAETGWRVVAAPGLREVATDVQCHP
jgi:hypothetical protein